MPPTAAERATPASGEMSGFGLTSITHGLPLLVDPQIDPGVVAQAVRVPRLARDLLDPRDQRRARVAQRDRPGARVVDVALLPLRRVAHDPRPPGRHRGEVDLVERQDPQLGAVADQRDVDLATLDVALGEHRLIELHDHVARALAQLRRRPHQVLPR